MKYIIDRFEGDMAILETENRETFSVPKKMLEGFREGDMFSVILEKEETKRRAENIKKLADELFE